MPSERVRNMEKRYYLAYGSNLNMKQMRWRCPTARPVGTAVLENYELLFKGSKTGAYLTVEPRDGSSVPLGVWAVGTEDELRLDYYEGYPGFYYKKDILLPIIGIRSGKVRVRKAFIYIMHEERPPGIPSPAYVYTCMDGYLDFGFDRSILSQACRRSIMEVGE